MQKIAANATEMPNRLQMFILYLHRLMFAKLNRLQSGALLQRHCENRPVSNVAQGSKPAVSRGSKPARRRKTLRASVLLSPADWKIDDAAGLETCATSWSTILCRFQFQRGPVQAWGFAAPLPPGVKRFYRPAFAHRSGGGSHATP